MPHLFTFSARTRKGLEVILNKARANATDLSTQFLLGNIAAEQSATAGSQKPSFRGFTILNDQGNATCVKEAPAEKRPIVCVFSGCLTEWQGVCREMMKVKTFENSIVRSDQYLSKYGVDLVRLLTFEANHKKTPLETMVAITAIHIALVDCLTQGKSLFICGQT